MQKPKLEIDNVFVNKSGNVIIALKTGNGFGRFFDMPLDIAKEVNERLKKLLDENE